MARTPVMRMSVWVGANAIPILGISSLFARPNSPLPYGIRNSRNGFPHRDGDVGVDNVLGDKGEVDFEPEVSRRPTRRGIVPGILSLGLLKLCILPSFALHVRF
jgi:hypothetical protein